MAFGPRSRCIAGLVLCTLVPACDEPGAPVPDTARPPIERRAFELVSGELQEAGGEVVTAIPIPAVFGRDWLRSNNSVELVTVHTGEGEVRAVRFGDPGLETSLRILRSVEGGAYDAIRLTLAAEGDFFLRALAGRRDGAVSTEIHPRRFPVGAGLGTADEPLVTHVHELDFIALLEAEGRFTELVLHKPTAESPLTIVGIELVDRQGRVPLPAPGAPRPVTVGDDSRPAVGLTPGLVLGVPLERGDERLAFDAALARGGPMTGTLRMRLVDAGGDVRGGDFEIGRAWRTIRVDVEPVARGGGRMLVEIEGDARALVASPRAEYPRPGSATGAPTVLFITSDTHRADHLGASSPPGFVDTPVLDALAAEGVMFTNVFSAANVTNPSHMSMMTGVHPRDTRVVDNASTLSDRARTLAEGFSAAGYATFAAVSAQHLAAGYAGLRQGFDRIDGPRVVPRDGEVTVRVLEGWLDDVEGLPVFLWLHVFDAHAPYTVPPELERRYYPADRDPRDPARSLGLLPEQVPPDLLAKGITDIDYPATQYRAEVTYLDSCLAPLLALPRVANGIVAFTADHGESLGDQGVWWGHEPLYPSTLHVPLILRWPGCTPGLSVDVPVETLDVGRTLLDLAGLDALPFPGRDLRWALDEPSRREPRFALSAYGWTACVEQSGWFFVLHLRPYRSNLSLQEHVTGEAYLYDLSVDPTCREDRLLPELPRATRMRAALLRWLADAAPDDLLEDGSGADAQQVGALEAMGYSGTDDVPRGRWWDPESTAPDWTSSSWRRLFEDEVYAREAFESAREH